MLLNPPAHNPDVRHVYASLLPAAGGLCNKKMCFNAKILHLSAQPPKRRLHDFSAIF
jgi:hypothetical protein